MRVIFTLALFLFCIPIFSQDLTGIWRGNFISADTKMNDVFNLQDRYKYEVQLDQQGKTFNGITYSYKRTEFYGKASSTGTVNLQTGKVILQEIKLLELKMASGGFACWMICFLQYTKNGDEEFLEGKYSSYRETDSSFCGRGTVLLRKVVTSDFYKEPFLAKREKEKKEAIAKKNTPVPAIKPGTASNTVKTAPKTVKPAPPVATPPKNNAGLAKGKPLPGNKIAAAKTTVPAGEKKEMKAVTLAPELDTDKKPREIKMKEPAMVPLVLRTRSNEVVQSISVSSNDITVNIYDNGTIDHDTVSVYLDKKLVVAHQMLTTSAITLHLKMDESTDYHELIMVADNLGDIPPNTSLMVVKAGDKQYEVRITSTEQKNAVVVFKYEKPK